MNIELDILWNVVLQELQQATSQPIDSDDIGMRDASADDLVMWVDDLEDRCGRSVDKLREAMQEFIFIRDGIL